MMYVSSYVFLAQWLNSGWLLMLANSNLIDQGIHILDLFLYFLKIRRSAACKLDDRFLHSRSFRNGTLAQNSFLAPRSRSLRT